jgi:hypothetical protein
MTQLQVVKLYARRWYKKRVGLFSLSLYLTRACNLSTCHSMPDGTRTFFFMTRAGRKEADDPTLAYTSQRWPFPSAAEFRSCSHAEPRRVIESRRG